MKRRIFLVLQHRLKILEKVQARREVSKITKVKEEKDGYSIMKSDGWSFYIPKKYGVVPKVGDETAFYGNPFQRVQGVDINGKELFFMTEAELNVEHEAFRKKFREDVVKSYHETMEKIKNDEPFETVDISGMSGSYEWGCQVMLRAGVKFLKEHPDFHFDYEQNPQIVGVCSTDTPWGKQLDKAVCDAADSCGTGGATGAMHQAVINHLAYIHTHGYDEWLKRLPKERRYMYPKGLPPPKP